MKLVILIVLALIVMINANPVSRTCECKAVSHNIHFPFHSWDLTSCKFCSCSDVAMTSCEQSCKTMVENYAKTGCGAVTKGTKVKYSFKASSCSKGISQEEHTCA
ncbi:unnamed protein product [Rotaria sp. Silwood1]|nr:unnamed protein product [Rotaria sp. Silwood1]CAF1006773.1 unnamed protein product [Rotaria sp. Silwood1]CAF1015614.1 unnamed protein product [Rotaria sp. Silwood1]CAF3397981.1 unnamed protein product [Rotaria sp. Silwood1]CAF3422155.1 unnamed protein product [Rotaria sp. Silwood1]